MASISSIPEVLRELRSGRFILLRDSPDRENEGDLVIPGALVTPQHVNFMLKFGRGELCTALPQEWADRLSLDLQPQRNTSPLTCAKCITVDVIEGTTTGVSAHDQARTIKRLATPTASSKDFRVPGHTHPLRARPGGVLERPGHTEGSVDLCRLAGIEPVAAICEILEEDGHSMRPDGLEAFSHRHGLLMTTIEHVILWRRGV